MAYHINSATMVHVAVVYEECQRNHVLGSLEKVLDGCGQFAASGPIGTPGEKVCAACHCHRNFHHRVVVDLPSNNGYVPPFGPHKHPEDSNAESEGYESSDLSHQPPAPAIPREGLNHQHQGGQNSARLMPVIPPMPFPDVKTEPGEEEVKQPRSAESRKRLTGEQSERLKAIARRNNWKIFREYSSEEVAEICSEIGIEKRSLKAWTTYHRSE